MHLNNILVSSYSKHSKHLNTVDQNLFIQSEMITHGQVKGYTNMILTHTHAMLKT